MAYYCALPGDCESGRVPCDDMVRFANDVAAGGKPCNGCLWYKNDEEPCCGNCKFLDECPDEWKSGQGGYCENWEMTE